LISIQINIEALTWISIQICSFLACHTRST